MITKSLESANNKNRIDNTYQSPLQSGTKRCFNEEVSAGLAFDRSMTDLLCHRSFFSCKDNTLNV